MKAGDYAYYVSESHYEDTNDPIVAKNLIVKASAKQIRLRTAGPLGKLVYAVHRDGFPIASALHKTPAFFATEAEALRDYLDVATRKHRDAQRAFEVATQRLSWIELKLAGMIQ